MQIEALSGIEAKVALVVLLAGEVVDVATVGARLGIARRQTVTDAARRVEEMGLVQRVVEKDRVIALAPTLQVSLSSSASSMSCTGANDGEAGESVSLVEREEASEPSASDGSGVRTITNYSRYPSFVGNLNTQPLSEGVAQQLAVEQTPLAQHVAVEQHLPQQLAVEQNDVAQQLAVELEGDLNTQPLSSGKAQHSAVEQTDLSPVELGMLRVETADALPGADTPSNQRYSPFVIRRKTQITTLLDLWGVLLPQVNVTSESLARLVAESGNTALPVAEMIVQTAERIAAGQEIKSPWGYIRSALKNQRERSTQTTPTQRSMSRTDPDELQDMTPEFQAELAALKLTAAKHHLWGE